MHEVIGPEMFLVSLLTYLPNFSLRQVECRCSQIIFESRLLTTGSNSHNALIYAPPQRDRFFTDVVLLGQGREDVINWTGLYSKDCGQRPKCRQRDALTFTPWQEVLAL